MRPATGMGYVLQIRYSPATRIRAPQTFFTITAPLDRSSQSMYRWTTWVKVPARGVQSADMKPSDG